MAECQRGSTGTNTWVPRCLELSQQARTHYFIFSLWLLRGAPQQDVAMTARTREERERSVLYQSTSIRASLGGPLFNTGQHASGRISRWWNAISEDKKPLAVRRLETLNWAYVFHITLVFISASWRPSEPPSSRGLQEITGLLTLMMDPMDRLNIPFNTTLKTG